MATLRDEKTGNKIFLRSLHAFGRNPAKADTVLANHDASQLYASIRWNGDAWELIDHSSNGTLLNGRRIANNVKLALAAGQTLQSAGPKRGTTNLSWANQNRGCPRIGDNNSASSIQIPQSGNQGNNNVSAISQNGDANNAQVNQTIGVSNSGTIAQTGNSNLAVINQLSSGLGNIDDDNIGNVSQYSLYQVATIEQFGSRNTANISQNGASNSAFISQTGVGHSLTVNQSGSSNSVAISQR